MSGFKDDVISILRQNGYLQRDALGWIVNNNNVSMANDLYEELIKHKFPVTNKAEKLVANYDYIIVDRYNRDAETILRAFASLSTGGLMVLEISDFFYKFWDKYVSTFAGFTATKVQYADRRYMVIHAGVDYGD